MSPLVIAARNVDLVRSGKYGSTFNTLIPLSFAVFRISAVPGEVHYTTGWIPVSFSGPEVVQECSRTNGLSTSMLEELF